jgi:two-component system, repressor protein LuxO
MVNKELKLPKLLLVDDDPSTRLLIHEISEGAKVSIIECGSGKEAISLFKEHGDDIALLLLDIKLKDCTGWELLGQLREMKPFVPAIAISAMAPGEIAKEYKKTGFDAFLSKPFEIEELIWLVGIFVDVNN